MLVRAGNEDEWLQLRPVQGLPDGGLRTLCGSDAANLLELDTPMPVAAFGPWPAGAAAGVDAVCLTPDGGIELLVGTWGESPRDTLWRLLDVAGALRGSSLEAFASHCTELGEERSVTRWLHARVGGDPQQLERRLRESLAVGDFGFVLVTGSGAGELAQPMHHLQQHGLRVRAFEVEILRAGDVQAIEGFEVPLLADADASHEPAPAPAVVEPAPWSAPQLAAVPQPEPEPAPAVHVEPEPAANVEPELEAHVDPELDATHVEPEPEPVQVEAPVALREPSDEGAFLTAVDRLDHRTSAHLRWLHGSLQRLVDELDYTADANAQRVAGWLHGTERLPLFALDSNGMLQLVLRSLPEHEQHEYAHEVAGMLPDADGEALLAAGRVDIDVPGHLDDQTLLEYLFDNLVEALPGGREAFGTNIPAPVEEAPGSEHDDDDVDADRAAGDLEPAGEDFFAGMSTNHDPADVPADMSSLDGEAARDDADEPTDQHAEQHHGGSRWLRRRGAA